MFKKSGLRAKNRCLLFTLCSDDYLMSSDAGILQASSELASAHKHFNVLPIFLPHVSPLWISVFHFSIEQAKTEGLC